MKSYQRILTFLLLMLLATSLLSPWFYATWDMFLGPWVAAIWQAFTGSEPNWRVPFPRFFNRTYMISGILLFFVCWKWLRIGSLRDLGLVRSKYGVGDVLRGFSFSLGSMFVIVGLMMLGGIFTPSLRYSFGAGLSSCLGALFAAFSVGILEEVFFRGMVFKGLLEDWRGTGAFVGANLFYSAIHFVSSPKQHFLDSFQPLAGFINLVESFHFFSTFAIIPGFIGLFLVGLVLSYAFYRTGALYLGIGAHAGWVFCLKSLKVFGKYRTQNFGWVFGTTKPYFVSGVVIWGAVLAVGAAVHLATRSRPTRLLSNPSSPGQGFAE